MIHVYELILSFFLFQVNKTHDSEDQMPQVSLFTGRNRKTSSATCSSENAASTSSGAQGTEQKVIAIC